MKRLTLQVTAQVRLQLSEYNGEQLSFLQKELKKRKDSDKPIFVVCHWPVYRVNGLELVYKDGFMGFIDSAKIHNTLKEYENVFVISGHAHAGVNGKTVNDYFGVNYLEDRDGVTYVNLPSFGLPNRFGVPWPCTGVHMEIYGDKVIFRPRNYLRGSWYTKRYITVELT